LQRHAGGQNMATGHGGRLVGFVVSEKLYLSAQGLLEDAFRLGTMVLRSGFRPTVMVAIWRGGAPIGITVQELLDAFGIETDHIAIRTSS